MEKFSGEDIIITVTITDVLGHGSGFDRRRCRYSVSGQTNI